MNDDGTQTFWNLEECSETEYVLVDLIRKVAKLNYIKVENNNEVTDENSSK